MDGVPVFLNERSYPIVAEQRAVMLAVVSLLRGLLRAKELAGNIYLGCADSLPSIPLTNDFQTLASIVKDDRELWRVVHNLEQRSPFGKVPQAIAPADNSHVDPASTKGDAALLWALWNEAFVASFPSEKEWTEPKIKFHRCECATSQHDSSTAAEVRNIATAQHADTWGDVLSNFMFTSAASSEIYDNGTFSLRMFLNDHSPPHIHVYLGPYSSGCVATVRFDTEPEILEGKGLTGSTKADVFELLRARRAELMISWARCRSGNHPNEL